MAPRASLRLFSGLVGQKSEHMFHLDRGRMVLRPVIRSAACSAPTLPRGVLIGIARCTCGGRARCVSGPRFFDDTSVYRVVTRPGSGMRHHGGRACRCPFSDIRGRGRIRSVSAPTSLATSAGQCGSSPAVGNMSGGAGGAGEAQLTRSHQPRQLEGAA